MHFRAITHADVHGKTMYYLVLRITDGTEHYVNIGEKTYKKVTNLHEQEITYRLNQIENANDPEEPTKTRVDDKQVIQPPKPIKQKTTNE